jgi:predicted adenylyl cyclase CyaB
MNKSINKNIEIEIRGPMIKEKFVDLARLFEIKGKKIVDKNRVLIDYSSSLEGGIENRHKDIRLRVTNGIPEIIVKLGKWGGIDQRREISVLAKKGEFDALVEIFGELGFRKGVLCVRNSKVYEYKGIEFALVEVPGHSYYYEAEKMASEKEDTSEITDEIVGVCKDLGLETFSQKQFFEYINKLNKEANEIFDYQTYIPNYFKDRFGL